MKLQVGMHVKMKTNEGYGKQSGEIKKITDYRPEYFFKNAYELDNETDAIYLAEDFEYCIEYPNQAIE